MKDITLKIVGKNDFDDEDSQAIEFITEGKMYEKAGSIYMIYAESQLCGMPGYKTSVKIQGDTVKMARYGKDKEKSTEMEFKKGERFASHYATDYGVFNLEILTKEMENTITYEDGGTLKLDYYISLNGLREARNQLSITVM